MKRLAPTLLPLVAIGAALLSVSASAAGSATVKVWFLKGEQMIAVERTGSTAQDALEQLLAGPTAAEIKRGTRTYVPAGVRLQSVSVANGVATVDLSIAFGKGRDSQSLLARLSQVVHTATGPEGATKVRLLLGGGTPLGLFPGVVTARPLTVEYLETPDVPAPKPPSTTAPPVAGGVRAAQLRLIDLGFLLPGSADGQLGPATQNAILAFQKWEGLQRDASLGPQTQRRLQVATRPEPLTRSSSAKRAEILIDRQVALAIQNNRVVRVVHISSGTSATPTPTGDYKVYAKIAKWWSVPFREWLLWALPFDGGIAFHELAEVPTYPASHGCVRESYTTAKWMYDFAVVGMPVKVLARSR